MFKKKKERKVPAPEVVFSGSSGVTIYDEIMVTARKISGVPWGYVKVGRRVHYVTSNEVPAVKFSAGKYDKRRRHYVPELDEKTGLGMDDLIFIVNANSRYPFWRPAMEYEIQQALMRVTRGDLKETIMKYKIDAEYMDLLKYMNEQEKKYPNEGRVYDAWIEECMRQSVKVVV